MLTSAIITFRETLEVVLVIGIILAYLYEIKRKDYAKFVWFGVISGLVLSVITAFIFKFFIGEFEGKAEQIFEGISMFAAAILLTYMIFWMMKKSHVKEIRENVSKKVEMEHELGLFFLSLVAVLREGVETVIFLGAANFVSKENNLIGALIGIVSALILGYLFFFSIKRIDLKLFFNITSILLTLFAAGLIAHGVHEFQEASLLPITIEHVWDTNNIINENGNFGGILKSLFGYNGDPSLLEIISYFGYLVFSIFIYKKNVKEKQL